MTALAVIVPLLFLGTTFWVGLDASRREWKRGSHRLWMLGCFLLWIVFFPLYLFKRGKAPLKPTPVPVTKKVSPPALQESYRECPFCKERMRRDASVCPHCRHDSTPWQFHDGRWWFRTDDREPWRFLDETTGAWVRVEPPPTQPVDSA